MAEKASALLAEILGTPSIAAGTMASSPLAGAPADICTAGHTNVMAMTGIDSRPAALRRYTAHS
ncbi:hypothetical protein [Arenibaculum pallidiluteum]|uniref:hypothetical protein n=1 Tax=Arenibaculum pallidiluteum TaxID=2812559 RepID=UPI001A9605CF|nr:hypothetical protein [Arenibaculum pallidiluteum]